MDHLELNCCVLLSDLHMDVAEGAYFHQSYMLICHQSPYEDMYM